MNQLPYSHDLQVKHLSSVFDNTTNSYKFYWFWAILDLLKNGEQRSEIPTREIIVKMIALSWYTVNYYKLSFGVLDKLGRSIKLIIEHTELVPDSSKSDIESTLNSTINNKAINKAINIFNENVSFRFIRPFFPELRGVKSVKKPIEELSRQFLNTPQRTSFYQWKPKSIVLNLDWRNYFLKHLKILEDFCLWNLVSFLQSRNPNVSNIGNKLLEPPKKRDLKKAYRFWQIASESTEIRCVYSDTIMRNDNISIDHFIPWSYVTHDLLWNLSPTLKNINSSKGNNLPHLDRYLFDFSNLQYRAFKEVYKKGEKKLLEDYTFAFQEELYTINSYRNDIFENKIKTQIIPLFQIAQNLGFQKNWSWKN